MTKPLELTVYPHVMDDGFDCIIDHEGTMRIPRECDDFAEFKQLTDAELAAEVFSAIFHEAECEVRGTRIERTWPARPAVERYVTQNHEFGRQAGILERFATLPHASENGYE